MPTEDAGPRPGPYCARRANEQIAGIVVYSDDHEPSPADVIHQGLPGPVGCSTVIWIRVPTVASNEHLSTLPDASHV